MTRDFKLVEHTLIPLALFALNMSSVHLIYLLFVDRFFSLPGALVSVCTFVLVSGILKKNKVLMVPAMVVYLLALVFSMA